MGEINHKRNYQDKLEKIKILESTTYHKLEKIQEGYKARVDFYKEQKDQIGTKIRMLEVYRNLWEDVELQIGDQAFASEEFWNNITFNILKYNQFIQEISEDDYSKKAKTAMDKKANKEVWNQREQAFLLMKNEINHMYSSFNTMHGGIHKRSLLQKECIEKHIIVMESNYKAATAEKEAFRSIFHEIRKDIGAKGNKFSKQALESYKISLIEKAQCAEFNSEQVEFDLAW